MYYSIILIILQNLQDMFYMYSIYKIFYTKNQKLLIYKIKISSIAIYTNFHSYWQSSIYLTMSER